ARIDTDSLAGVVCYDAITWAAPGWRVLMRDQSGGPAVLEACVGHGRVIVIEPSFDRLTRETSKDERQGAACEQFIKNLAALITTYRPR
ncbi:MAG: hypothetical protein H5T86_12940, partial [Armatimonadetes bacterium]|nr:hypothetical protein [Armatimonadota bacterium]